MESAPKDRRILLYYEKPIFTGYFVTVGKWCQDEYSKYPKPYWENDVKQLSGILRQRDYQPTLWAEIELPKPKEE